MQQATKERVRVGDGAEIWQGTKIINVQKTEIEEAAIGLQVNQLSWFGMTKSCQKQL